MKGRGAEERNGPIAVARKRRENRQEGFADGSVPVDLGDHDTANVGNKAPIFSDFPRRHPIGPRLLN